MKTRLSTVILAAMALLLPACKHESRLHVQFPERFEGKNVEMISFLDSTVVASAEVLDGTAEFVTNESDSLRLPAFMQLMVDGRVCGYYIAEQGNATLSDSTNLATGTPLNDRFAELMARLDSIENLDDMRLYVDFTERQYNENRDNPLGDYFAVEWLKYADPSRVDSLLSKADPALRDSRRVRYYENFARLRMQTSPGHKFVDFKGENDKGRPARLSSLMKPGKYTVVDFWASWCPYCIRELPALQKLRADLGDRLEIVGVAVRDLPADTKAMVEKHEIPWPVLYNTQRVPYDIYGFTGIPHLMLIDPDGVIVSRGESVSQIRSRLE